MAEDKKIKYLDKSYSLDERKQFFKEEIDKTMNPVPDNDFNPETFEPMGADMAEISDRVREIPSKYLPITYNLKPKPVREGQMVGMFESKQDIYLTFAHRCNDLQKQIDDLVEIINNIKK